jgi:hypothetical protein
MAVILTLLKTGGYAKTRTKQNVTEIWELMAGSDPNNLQPTHRDYILLLDNKNQPLIINRRFIFRIDEDTIRSRNKIG